MVVKRMKPAQAMRLVHKAARRVGLNVVELRGRGKGSHRIYALVDSEGAEVGRFGLTSHARELSWAVLRNLEDGLARLFGEKWMEES
ncbi:hypothetical protein F0L68_23270 [Solihabitans fulvus]|uniref:Uncharacterized protein n=1 Tax=Solihabitans fulvus TaxID=1892852 RepID=A0A5B2X685_9PSEU|nr:hypothetical protein [Solihabitans fulvus]KAA2258754.1 hypothetical protein F0L68_23270 [Solihabitans fulvus]